MSRLWTCPGGTTMGPVCNLEILDVRPSDEGRVVSSAGGADPKNWESGSTKRAHTTQRHVKRRCCEDELSNGRRPHAWACETELRTPARSGSNRKGWMGAWPLQRDPAESLVGKR